MPRWFVGEKDYNASPVMFLGRKWNLQLGTVNGKICKIAPYLVLKDRKEANAVAAEVLTYCLDNLGQPSEQKRGLFIWDTADGNAVFQTGQIGEEVAVNLFITSRSIQKLALIGPKRLSQTSDQTALLHFYLGYVMGEQNRWSDAITEYRTAIRLEPDLSLAHYNLGLGLDQEGDLGGAITEYREAIRLQPDLVVAHSNLSYVLRKKGDLDGAVAEARTAIRLRPELSNPHQELGIALAKKHDFDAAITQFRIVIQLDPNNPKGHIGLGMALASKGEVQAGLSELQRACELDPTNSEYRSTYENIQRIANQR